MVSDRRQDAAACVSLSKSTMSKTRPVETKPADNARRRRGGASLSAPHRTVNRLAGRSGKRPESERKNRLGPPGHAPSVRRDSIEGAENMPNARENQALFASRRPRHRKVARPAHAVEI